MPPLVQTGFDAEPTESQQFRAVLALVLRPAILRAFEVRTSAWFELANERLADPLLCSGVVTALFDGELLAAFGHSGSERWFAYASRCLCGADAPDERQHTQQPAVTVPVPVPVPVTVVADSRNRTIYSVTATGGGDATPDSNSGPPAAPEHALPALPESTEENAAPPERMLRLLPEVTRQVTAGARSVEALANAVFTHLTGHAA